MNKYKITWEMVSPFKGVQFYINDEPNAKLEQVPEEFWHSVERESDDPWDQYETLKLWENEGVEYVRNVKLYELVSDPKWQEVKNEA